MFVDTPTLSIYIGRAGKPEQELKRTTAPKGAEWTPAPSSPNGLVASAVASRGSALGRRCADTTDKMDDLGGSDGTGGIVAGPTIAVGRGGLA